MDIDEALDLLEGGEIKVYETPFGTKLSVTTPSGEDWHVSGDELTAAKQVTAYEDVVTAVYEADNDDEVRRIINDAEVDAPCKVIGRVENITLSTEGCRNLAD